MKPVSVLGIISFKIFPAQMGGQRGIAGFYSALAKKAKVVLAVSKGNEPAGIENISTTPFLYHHKWGFANIVFLYRLSRIIQKESIDYIIIDHSYLGWLGILLRKITGKPFLIRSHNIEAHRFRDMKKIWWRIYLWYEQKVHRVANHSFFITDEDRIWAIANWQLSPEICSTVTYGTDLQASPGLLKRAQCREQLLQENGLSPETALYLFNGTLDYAPNTDALRVILSELMPLLVSLGFPFRILICGNRLHPDWEKVLRANPYIIYKGFVPDISYYLLATDTFINPVTLGSGIKTKLVDALAHNQTCVSTKNGARGIPEQLTGNKLIITEDYNWQAFVQAMYHASKNNEETIPESFYQNFNWNNIVRKALLSLPTE
jgi:hypothetical protein